MKITLIALCLFSFGCGFKLNSVYVAEYRKIIGEALKAKKEHPEQNVFDGEIEPVLPNEEENFKTILGIDANHNGIRDDVEIWINRTGVDYNERMAMRQLARAEQANLVVCKERDELNSSKVASLWLTGASCIWGVVGYKQINQVSMRDDIASVTLNTKMRNDCMEFYDEAPMVAKAKFSDPFKNCDFKIQNSERLLRDFDMKVNKKSR